MEARVAICSLYLVYPLSVLPDSSVRVVLRYIRFFYAYCLFSDRKHKKKNEGLGAAASGVRVV